MPESNEKILPLYRHRTFRRRERLLLKYVEKFNWFTNVNLGDQHRNEWKSRINRRRKNGIMKRSSGDVNKNITSATFVSGRKNSELFSLIREKEEKPSKQLSWGGQSG